MLAAKKAKMGTISFLLMFLFATSATATEQKTFDVVQFGAKSGGKNDCTKAFLAAWAEACEWEGAALVLVPKGQFSVGPVKFDGPCKGPITFQLQGTILAPTDLNVFSDSGWVAFHYIDGLTVTGHGTFDGQGAVAWPHNKCPKTLKCKPLPSSLTFGSVNNSLVESIRSLNSKMFHVMVFNSHNLKFKGVTITAPDESPNTDGIHIGVSSNIEVTDSKIGTGDDCISIGPSTAGVKISRVFCGPGHGISVGSLGKYEDDKDVTDIHVSNCTLTNTTNGVRIKTWEDSTVLAARNFTFENIVMNDVANPIIIDQEYCPTGGCGNKAPSNVKISDIKFKNIRGTSSTNVAVNLVCSKKMPCGVELSDIHLEYTGKEGKATSSCTNAHASALGTVVPAACA